MQLSKILSIVSFTAAASATTVSYDQGYDNPSRPLTEVACSDGTNGLIWKYNWHTQGEIARFPHIGGSESIPGWNSPNCGTCWSATYNGKTVYVLAIDHAAAGLNIGLGAFNELTGGHGVELGRVDANVQQVALSNCGL